METVTLTNNAITLVGMSLIIVMVLGSIQVVLAKFFSIVQGFFSE